jgi:trans-aconitate 2-methyltransferase
MPTWNPNLYLKFSAERTRPAADLASRIPTIDITRVVDLGCGPGNSTAVLRSRWPTATIIGVDNSPEMIDAARFAYPAGEWIAADLTEYAESGFDLVFSNAALQWVPNHDVIFPKLLSMTRAGGVLAVQVPLHHRSLLHGLIAEVAERPAWRDRLAQTQQKLRMETPEFYYDILRPHAATVDVWVTEYRHLMTEAEGVIDWIRGSGLRPYLAALADDAERAEFVAALRVSIEHSYTRRVGGGFLFPYPRLFILAISSGSSDSAPR